VVVPLLFFTLAFFARNLQKGSSGGRHGIYTQAKGMWGRLILCRQGGGEVPTHQMVFHQSSLVGFYIFGRGPKTSEVVGFRGLEPNIETLGRKCPVRSQAPTIVWVKLCRSVCIPLRFLLKKFVTGPRPVNFGQGTVE